MDTFLLVVVLVVLFVRWLILSRRLRELHERVANLSNGEQRFELIRRIYALEQEVKKLQAERASQPAAEPVPTPESIVAPPPAPEPEPVATSVVTEVPPPLPDPIVERTTPPPLPIRELEPVPAPLFAQHAVTPRPGLAERVRESMQGEEWEAVVGGSWLNKLGVLVLVIGVALFLGYSFTQVNPAGRAAIGVGVSVLMLSVGLILERRARYRIFARGFLGGGWAALYFTVYAMQAIDAAKVIDNPVLGAILLVAVAAGMIVHSLKYRSQTVTGLAYFVAFATLSPAVTPAAVTAISVIALVPLAASLLFVAWRFSWSEMALLGLLATYGTCASRGDSGAPLWSVQLLFTTYWLLFEGFDLLRAARHKPYSIWESAIFPMNALAFVGLSYGKWSIAAPHQLHLLAGGVGAAYLAGAILRAWLRPPSSFPAEANTLERAMSGGYEGPISLAAGLTVAAISLKFHGTVALAGLLAEAELLFLAGLLFKQAYPRQLAAALFAGGMGKMVSIDLIADKTSTLGGWTMKAWTPAAALAALLFYLNRALRTVNISYGFAGSALVALIIGFETPQRYLGMAWLLLSALLFVFGWWRRLSDFRTQGYFAGALGFGGISVHQADIAQGFVPAPRHPWISLAVASALSYAAALCGLRSSEARLESWEKRWLRRIGSWSTTAALLALAWRLVPDDYLGIAWISIALAVLELGLRALPDDFRVQAYAAAALGALRVGVVNFLPVNNTDPFEKRLILVYASVLAYAFAARIHLARSRIASASERSNAFHSSTGLGTLYLLAGLWALLPAVAVGPAWAMVALLLMEIGIALELPGLRLQSHLVAGATFARMFFANFTGLGRTGFLTHRVLTVVPVLISYYYEWARQNRLRERLRSWELPLRRAYLYAPAILAVALMRFELGRVLAVTGWAAFALVLLYFGRRWNESDLRWQSYILATLAFWRSWTTNFYAPESFAGVSGRVLTGAFVIACLYVAQLMIPRRAPELNGIERHARTFYSLLAASLLAVLLFYEVSGSMLTVTWGIEGLALLSAGFPLNDRVQRLSGMFLFLVCILKLFVYDLRHLETMYRILSFIVLGLMLVGVSWVYTRFRDRIQRYL